MLKRSPEKITLRFYGVRIIVPLYEVVFSLFLRRREFLPLFTQKRATLPRFHSDIFCLFVFHIFSEFRWYDCKEQNMAGL